MDEGKIVDNVLDIQATQFSSNFHSIYLLNFHFTKTQNLGFGPLHTRSHTENCRETDCCNFIRLTWISSRNVATKYTQNANIAALSYDYLDHSKRYSVYLFGTNTMGTIFNQNGCTSMQLQSTNDFC